MKGQSWALGLAQGLTAAGAIMLLSIPVRAQTVREDNTLGAENSRVIRDVQIRGRQSDRIEGGARRGQNLFHSFEQFDVPEGRGAYFLNPDGVRNIFSRVTGGDRSEINGALGVIQGDNLTLGNANLFFINPNGILFGVNSSLDVGGSFVGTTANGMQFGDRGVFSTDDRVIPNLLTVNPSAFFFNQLNTGTIVNQSRVNAGRDPSGSFSTFGLRVLDGQSLLLLGGDINLNGGGIVAFGGQVDLGGVTGSGVVGLTVDANNLRLNFPENASRANVSLTNRVGNRAGILTAGNNGGSVNIIARNINISGGSSIYAGIGFNLGSISSQAGNITLDATGSIVVSGFGSYVFNYIDSNATGTGGDVVIKTGQLTLDEGARIAALTFGEGNSGNVKVDASNSIDLDGGAFGLLTGLFAQVDSQGNGNSGNISVKTQRLNIENGAQIGAITFGTGNAGALNVDASTSIDISGEGSVSSGLLVGVESDAQGNARGLTIDTGRLSVRDGAEVAAFTAGRGSAGDLVIRARDSVNVVSSPGTFTQLNTDVKEGAEGNSGNLTVETRRFLADSAQVSASVFGRGNTGNLTIKASDSVELRGEVLDRNRRARFPGGILSQLNPGAVGQGRDSSLSIETRRLSISNGSKIQVGTFGDGDAGALIIHASDVDVFNTSQPFYFTGIFAGILQDPQNFVSLPKGNGGSVTIEANRLSIRDGARVTADVSGVGRGGRISIQARDAVEVVGAGSKAPSTLGTEVAPPGVSIPVSPEEISGHGGDLIIQTRQLSVRDGGRISTSTFGGGDAGSIDIQNAQLVEVTGRSPSNSPSSIRASVGEGASGAGGQLTITSQQLNVRDGGEVSASTSGTGSAGNIQVQGANSVNLDNGSISTAINNGATADRRGNIDIQTRLLSLTNGAQVTTSTSGTGSAGSVRVQGADTVRLDRSNISTIVNTRAIGDGGNIDIQTRSLSLGNGAQVTASTSGTGSAGNIQVQGANSVTLDNGSISTAINNGATAERRGSIDIQTRSLSLGNGAQVTASTSGTGSAGNISVRGISGINRTSLDNSTLSATVNRGAVGQGGNISIQTNSLELSDQSRITSSTSGQGSPGQVSVRATEGIGLSHTSSITSTVGQGATGNSRNITLQTPRLTLRGNSEISAATDGNGSAGNVTVRGVNSEQASDSISLTHSSISTEIQGNGIAPGNQGNNSATRDRRGINLRTRSLSLNNGADITASTRGRGDAGSIVIQDLNNLSLGDRTSIAARTSRQGDAGNITIRNSGITSLNNGAITTEVSAGAKGQGGDINLNTASLNLENAQVSSSTNGRGNAGNININATGTLRSRDSSITTEASRASGGAIDILAEDIRLRGNSDIRTQVEQGAGGGGNISAKADSLVAFDDSDIIAAAAKDGRGGNISFGNTIAFFENNQPNAATANPATLENNQRADINATGAQPGTITLPDTSFIQNSLTDLPENALDADSLISNSCIARTQQGGTFLVTGSGGLPPRPGVAPLSPYPTGTVRTQPDEEQTTAPAWHQGEPIVEPQGVYQLEDGELVLSRECH